MKPIARAEQVRALGALVARAGAARPGAPRLVVFDLDGTLIDNRPRTGAILREIATEWASSRPATAARLAQVDDRQLQYLLADNLQALGIEDDAILADITAIWRSRFFIDPHIAHDIAQPGAVAFARALHARGATLIYFTGRDLPNMALGTFASLRDLGFPIGVSRTELVLKPDPETSDADFKREVTPELGRSGQVIGTFENEPGNANIFCELHPEADHFLLATQHVPNPPALSERVRVIADFELDP